MQTLFTNSLFLKTGVLQKSKFFDFKWIFLLQIIEESLSKTTSSKYYLEESNYH